jgi:hypothetical protein
MDAVKTRLIEAEEKAAQLFQIVGDRGLIAAGKTKPQHASALQRESP